MLVDEYPLIVPVNYRLVELPGRNWIAIRTRSGGVIERALLQVAFEIDDIAGEHREGWSVVVRGTLHHVDPDAADFRERFDPNSWLQQERDAWMVIDAFQITGRVLRDQSRPWQLEDLADSLIHAPPEPLEP
jgi:nitroimidazol reductase NimA-like FMN-containing flavoprotein (pyridoxamine 5'-phosphate oxidase superfamily)